MITLGLISDTHIPERANSLDNSIHEIFKQVDVILHAGDITSMDVIIELEVIAPVEAVRGNMDRYGEINFPEYKVLEYENVKIGLCHGAGDRHNIMDRMIYLFRPFGVKVIVFGHTHDSVITQRNGIYLINPGTAADRVFSSKNSVGILQLSEGKVLHAEIAEINF